MTEFSVEDQKEISKRIGYNPKKWEKDNPEEEKKLLKAAMNALLKNTDINGKVLTIKEREFLCLITGRC